MNDTAATDLSVEREDRLRGTEAVDDYLEAILELEEEGAPVIQARLATRLGISAPSVSEMVRRLRAEG
jgi:DtxR family Mn-dependent transcriptional regulator